MDGRQVDFVTRFLLESDAIEGIGNDPDEVRRQVVAGSASGHVGALLLAHNVPLLRPVPDETLVRDTQRLIVEEQPLKGERSLPERLRGQWRDRNVHLVRVRGGEELSRRRIGSDHGAIAADMASWLAEAQRFVRECGSSPKHRVVRDAAYLHWRYERIHPFADGNGRSGRALSYALYRWAGLQPFLFTAHDRAAAYYPCFGCGDAGMMERYFLERTR